MLEGKVDSSGWTTHENFDKAVEYFSRLREAGLDSLVGEELAEFEAETRWILDHTARQNNNSGSFIAPAHSHHPASGPTSQLSGCSPIKQ